MRFLASLALAFRYWLRHKGVALAVCTILSGSMAAALSIYTVLDGVWLRAVPYAETSSLVALARVDPASGHAIATSRDYAAWQTLNDTFDIVGAFTSNPAYVATSGEAERMTAIAASPSLFAALRESAQVGRLFDTTDHDVTVLTSRGLGGRLQGRTIGDRVTIDGRPTTIIGTLPARFSDMIPGDLVVPLPPRPSGTMKVVARLRQGVSPAAAAAALDGAALAAGGPPEAYREWHSRVQPVRTLFVGEHVGRTLWVLLAMVVLLQVIGAANASLVIMLATESERQNVAIRMLLGVPMRELLRDVAVRGTVLVAAATVTALLIVAWVRHGLVALIPVSVPRLSSVSVNTRAVVFSVVSAGVVALLLAYGPMLAVSRTSPLEALRVSAGRRKSRITQWFIAAEAALACVITIAAVSFAQSVTELTSHPLGFEAHGIVVFGLDAPGVRPFDWRRHEPVRRAALAELETTREVASAAGSDMPPFSGMGAAYSFQTLDGATGPAADAEVMIDYRLVTPNYFRTLAIPLVSGRDFSRDDQPGTTPVAIVNELAARRFWPATSPIGKRIRVSSWTEPVTIVGVVGNVRQVGFDRDPVPQLYRPWLQDPRGGLYMLVRPAGSIGTFVKTMSRDDRPLARGAAVTRVRLLSDDLDRSIAQQVFRAQLLWAFAVVAMLICAAGVIAVSAARVIRSRRDIAIRLSLGAGVTRLVRGFTVREATLPTLAGVTAGALTASAVRPLLAGVLPSETILDGSTVAIASLLIVVSAGLASGITCGLLVRRSPLALLKSE